MSSIVVSDRARGAAKGALLGACAAVPQWVMTWRVFRLGHGSRWLMLLPFSVAAACGAVAGLMAARLASPRLRKVFAISLAAYLASAVILCWIATMDSVAELLRHGPAQFRRWEHVPLVLLETALFSIVIAVQGLWINGIPLLAFVFVIERWTRPKVVQRDEPHSNAMRALGWVIAIVGTVTSIGVFWIDHMNAYTREFMLLGIGSSVILGWVIALRAGKRR